MGELRRLSVGRYVTLARATVEAEVTFGHRFGGEHRQLYGDDARSPATLSFERRLIGF